MATPEIKSFYNYSFNDLYNLAYNRVQPGRRQKWFLIFAELRKQGNSHEHLGLSIQARGIAPE
jgi:hypothetical protein